MGTVVCGGSRSLSSEGVQVCRVLARHFLQQGHSLSVGCATGADIAFAEAFICGGAAARLSVFAVGGSGGSGFPSHPSGGLSSFYACRSFASAGASVTWNAGGIDNIPITARLAVRAEKAVNAADIAAVFVVSQPHSRGSLVAAGKAARRGLPVFFFCDGFPYQALPALPGKYKDQVMPGCWSLIPAGLGGLPCVQWVAAQQPLF